MISGNFIGTNVDGNALGNFFSGIHLSAGARSNQIGPQNTIAYNGLAGVRVYGSNDTTAANTITKNRIYSNASAGIDLVNDGNNNVAPPVIEVATATQISGQRKPMPSSRFSQMPKMKGIPMKRQLMRTIPAILNGTTLLPIRWLVPILPLP